MWEEGVHGNSVPSAQLCCEPKTALKKQSIKKEILKKKKIKKSSVFCQSLATASLFTVSITLPFPGCQIVGIIPYMTFSDWLLLLGNMHLRLFHVLQMVNGHMKRCSTLLIIREMQIKATTRHDRTLVKTAISKVYKKQRLEKR